MTTQIVTKANSCEVAAWITKFLAKAHFKLIRLEGVCGSGKTTIAHTLATAGVGIHIEVDRFVVKPTKHTLNA